MTECSDRQLHRSRVDGRERGIPGWYELDWSQVERSRASWDPDISVDVRIDTAEPWSTIRGVLGDHIATRR
jgi:hypothetical protein